MNIRQDLKFQLAITWVSILLYLHGSDCLPTDGGRSTINKGGGRQGGQHIYKQVEQQVCIGGLGNSVHIYL